MKGGFHEQLFGSVCIRFYEKKWCSMFHSYMFQNVSFNSMESWMFVPRKLLKLHQKAGSNFHHVTPWAWRLNTSLELPLAWQAMLMLATLWLV